MQSQQIQKMNFHTSINRGETYFGMGKYEEYITNLNSALETHPYDAKTLRNRGDLYMNDKI